MHQFKKINIPTLVIFIFDLVIFSGIVIGFAFQLCGDKISKLTANSLSYMVLIFSFYILIKFTITNFFYSNSYFFKTIVYKKNLEIHKVTIEKNEIINSTPYWFLSLLIFTNVFSTIVINFQVGSIFNDNDIIAACISTLSSILLIPSFAAILNKITEIKKPIINSYINLVKNQFVTFKDLFKNIEFEDNFQYIKFDFLNLKSKDGVFIIPNISKKENQEIIDFNQSILDFYQAIWEKYYYFLLNTRQVKNKKYRYQIFCIERRFDQIFINFLNLK